jgi:hypothetical protein
MQKSSIHIVLLGSEQQESLFKNNAHLKEFCVTTVNELSFAPRIPLLSDSSLRDQLNEHTHYVTVDMACLVVYLDSQFSEEEQGLNYVAPLLVLAKAHEEGIPVVPYVHEKILGDRTIKTLNILLQKLIGKEIVMLEFPYRDIAVLAEKIEEAICEVEHK